MDFLRGFAEYFVGHFTYMHQRTFWFFLVTAMALAFVVYVRKTGRRWSLKGFTDYVFDRNIWLHRSSVIDYKYFIVNGAVMALIFTPIIGLFYPALLKLSTHAFSVSGLPVIDTPQSSAMTLYMLTYILIVDFGVFFAHYLSHKVPFLWQFHKVHHSAEVLNPMTLYRQHPVDLIINGIVIGTLTAISHAGFSYIFADVFTVWKFGGLTLVTLLFYLLGYNLRHSHIRLSFGPVIEKWIVSPVMHQVHHSSLEHHWDKNMGLIFSIWDRLFGTLHIYQKDEPITLGLPRGEAAEFNKGLFQCYFLPFKKAYQAQKTTCLTLMVFLTGGMALSSAQAKPQYHPPYLHLEELTWDETQEALEANYTHVIIPTGGTEQNGRHVILGKHNYVIKHAAEEVASMHGQMLIAPVMAYVPEGRISPPEGHMKYTGTLSLREDVFEAVLEDTAKSLFQHGFTHVYILGDSGSSVEPQNRVVKRVSEGLNPHQHFVHLDQYYLANKQVDELLDDGFSRDAIGYHAGIRDTSELIYVHRDGVREGPRRNTVQTDGATGAYWKASKEIGEKMMSLKVQAALKQIDAYANSPAILASNDK